MYFNYTLNVRTSVSRSVLRTRIPQSYKHCTGVTVSAHGADGEYGTWGHVTALLLTTGRFAPSYLYICICSLCCRQNAQERFQLKPFGICCDEWVSCTVTKWEWDSLVHLANQCCIIVLFCFVSAWDVVHGWGDCVSKYSSSSNLLKRRPRNLPKTSASEQIGISRSSKVERKCKQTACSKILPGSHDLCATEEYLEDFRSKERYNTAFAATGSNMAQPIVCVHAVLYDDWN